MRGGAPVQPIVMILSQPNICKICVDKFNDFRLRKRQIVVYHKKPQWPLPRYVTHSFYNLYLQEFGFEDRCPCSDLTVGWVSSRPATRLCRFQSGPVGSYPIHGSLDASLLMHKSCILQPSRSIPQYYNTTPNIKLLT